MLTESYYSYWKFSFLEGLLSEIYRYGATANNQLTIDPKKKKLPALGSQNESIIAFEDLRFTSVSTL